MFDDDNGSIALKTEGSAAPTVFEPQKENAEQTLTRHSVYCFEPVVFRVEGFLFKVPKYGLMVPGSMFYDMFSLPIPEGEQAEGSDSNPINLPSGITAQEFFGFLFVLYPYLGDAYGAIRYQELVGALKLGTMWQFPRVRKGAVFLLSNVVGLRNPVEIILLAKQYDVKTLLRQGYINLVTHTHTVETLRVPFELDWETISKIFATKLHLTEKYSVKFRNGKAQRLSNDSNNPDLPTNSDADAVPEASLNDYLEIIFGEEFKRLEDNTEPDSYDVQPLLEPYIQGIKENELKQQTLKVLPEQDQDVQTTESCSVTLPEYHIYYYLEMMSIHVENTLFSVPRRIFGRIFDHPESDTNNFEEFRSPDCEYRPLTAQSFSRFLSILYPIQLNSASDHDRPSDYDGWLDVLHISCHWGFPKIRQQSITEMSSMLEERDPVETVLMARRYKIKTWVVDALVELVIRNPESDLIQELRTPLKLDWKTIAKLLSIRCRSHRIPLYLRRPKASCQWCKNFADGTSNHTSGKTSQKMCAHACKRLKLPVDDLKYDAYDRKKRVGLESEPDWQRSKDVIRSMVVEDFSDEVIDWIP